MTALVRLQKTRNRFAAVVQRQKHDEQANGKHPIMGVLPGARSACGRVLARGPLGIGVMKKTSFFGTLGFVLTMITACGGDKPAAPAAGTPAAAAPAATPPAAAPTGQGGAGGAAPATPPPPTVGVVKALLEEATLVNELPGRIEAVRTAQIRARVAGVIQKRLFTEGSDVKAGQVLYQIDAAPFRATLDAAQAALRKSEATLMQASAQAKRLQPLVAVDAVSQQEYSNAQAAEKQAEADVASGRAAVQTARINLGYTSVTAPIAGRIGRSLVTEGALVGQGEATQLALIQQINPVFVNFTQPAGEVLRLRQAIAQGRLKSTGGTQGGGAVRVMLEDGSSYPQTGRLLFSDLSVDQASGQVTLRAELPNPDGLLLPGMYVRVRVDQARYESVVLLPQQSVQRSAQGDTVMVVDDKGMVSPRPVKIGGAQGTRWIVTEGLTPGETVVVDGFQKMRPGAPVRPVPWQPIGTPGAAAGSSPGAGQPPAAAPKAAPGAAPAAAPASPAKQ